MEDSIDQNLRLDNSLISFEDSSEKKLIQINTSTISNNYNDEDSDIYGTKKKESNYYREKKNDMLFKN